MGSIWGLVCIICFTQYISLYEASQDAESFINEPDRKILRVFGIGSSTGIDRRGYFEGLSRMLVQAKRHFKDTTDGVNGNLIEDDFSKLSLPESGANDHKLENDNIANKNIVDHINNNSVQKKNGNLLSSIGTNMNFKLFEEINNPLTVDEGLSKREMEHNEFLNIDNAPRIKIRQKLAISEKHPVTLPVPLSLEKINKLVQNQQKLQKNIHARERSPSPNLADPVTLPVPLSLAKNAKLVRNQQKLQKNIHTRERSPPPNLTDPVTLPVPLSLDKNAKLVRNQQKLQKNIYTLGRSNPGSKRVSSGILLTNSFAFTKSAPGEKSGESYIENKEIAKVSLSLNNDESFSFKPANIKEQLQPLEVTPKRKRNYILGKDLPMLGSYFYVLKIKYPR